MPYDIIGDVHGHHDKLFALLGKLGYRDHLGVWRHPERTAIFVGDLIDRGPGQLTTVDTVRRMVDAGSAIALMGNHEFNAIAWHTPDLESPGQHLRVRSPKNRDQHNAFLTEVEHQPAKHAELVNWFMTLPLWLELPGLRVVHACWHPGHMAMLAPLLSTTHCLTEDLVVAASRPHDPAFTAVEVLLKGLEIELPSGISFRDPNDVPRTSVRTKWWNADADTYRKAALLPEHIRARLPETALPAHAQLGYADTTPVFFGHYWHSGEPAPLTTHAACVDYSAGKQGPLVAYRWEGERELRREGFVASG